MPSAASGAASGPDRPGFVAPMLAVPGGLPPAERADAWAAEVKWDGMRVVTAVAADGSVRAYARSGADAGMRFPETAELGERLAGTAAVLDGEVVALDPTTGLPSFGRLQERMGLRTAEQVRAVRPDVPVTLMLFDVLHLDGRDTTALPYRERRELLTGLGLEGADAVQVPPAWLGDPRAAVAWTRAHRLEGVVLKRLDSRYRPGARSRDWVKLKYRAALDVRLGGWLADANGEPRSLLVGEPLPDAPDRLRYLGAVGSGLGPGARRTLAPLLAEHASRDCPFDGGVRDLESRVRSAHWLRPDLTGEVEYAERTATGRLRQPAWHGLR